jgi:hypothetical protein
VETWTFEALGRTVTVEAENRIAAMGEANRLFGPLPQGAWMDRNQPRAFHWAKGNFFD